MGNRKNLFILILSLLLAGISIGALILNRTTGSDYRNEMGDCNGSWNKCQKASANPYIVSQDKFICKNSKITETEFLINIPFPVENHTKDATEFAHPEDINNSLYNHMHFYIFMENTLFLIPILQVISTFVLIGIIGYNISKKYPPLKLKNNRLLPILSFCQSSAIYTLLGCVFGLAIAEIKFKECLHTNSPEWMIKSGVLAKIVYYTWLIGEILFSIGSNLMFLPGICWMSERSRKLHLKNGLRFSIIGVIILMLQYIPGVLFFFILWFTCRTFIYSSLYLYIL